VEKRKGIGRAALRCAARRPLAGLGWADALSRRGGHDQERLPSPSLALSRLCAPISHAAKLPVSVPASARREQRSPLTCCWHWHRRALLVTACPNIDNLSTLNLAQPVWWEESFVHTYSLLQHLPDSQERSFRPVAPILMERFPGPAPPLQKGKVRLFEEANSTPTEDCLKPKSVSHSTGVQYLYRNLSIALVLTPVETRLPDDLQHAVDAGEHIVSLQGCRQLTVRDTASPELVGYERAHSNARLVHVVRCDRNMRGSRGQDSPLITN